ncbi:hypothetical protein BaRGS_00021104, partial [Batillaria attramentaria]
QFDPDCTPVQFQSAVIQAKPTLCINTKQTLSFKPSSSPNQSLKFSSYKVRSQDTYQDDVTRQQLNLTDTSRPRMRYKKK